MSKSTVKIGKKKVQLSNLEKELYPSSGFTKARVLEYYGRMAPYILPCLKDRAVTLKRYPNGVKQDFFFEKRCPKHPYWVQTAVVPYGAGRKLTACLVNSLETLIWVENLASIELHVPLARAQSPATPDSVVFDLDPGKNADILDCAKVADALRTMLARLGLVSFVKTSGKKGLHVYVPLNSRQATFDGTKKFSRAVAEIMQKNYPGLVTAKMDIAGRKGKVFINWQQNDASKTMVCAYSLRAGERPTVSFPLEWKELEKLAKKKDPEKLQFTYSEAHLRVQKYGDAFREMPRKKQRLPFL